MTFEIRSSNITMVDISAVNGTVSGLVRQVDSNSTVLLVSSNIRIEDTGEANANVVGVASEVGYYKGLSAVQLVNTSVYLNNIKAKQNIIGLVR